MIDNSNGYVPPGLIQVGVCSKCGGKVCVYSIWCSVVSDVPKCINCGATKRQDVQFPVIDMD